MDLLLVTGRFPQRSETFIYRKAVALAERGHRVTVSCRGEGDWGLYPEPLPPTLEVVVAPPDAGLHAPRRALEALAGAARSLYRPAEARALLDCCRTDPRTRGDWARYFVRHLIFLGRKPDVVHFEFLGGDGMHPLARELTGAPIAVSCRGSDLHMLELQPEAVRSVQLATLREVDAIHCVSAELANLVATLTGRTHNVFVNRPAVDVARIRPRVHDRSASDPLRILASGRLTWKKGFDYLLMALAMVMRRGVPVRAEILGDGELKKSLRYSIGDLGLQHVVTLPGGVPPGDVLARLQTTDLFVLPSLDEGISNAVLEAMASAVPVVTTRVGGMTEAVTDGVEGLVVPPRDADALARAIEALAHDPVRAAAMGAAGRARVEADFSIDRQVTRFEELYAAMVRR